MTIEKKEDTRRDPIIAGGPGDPCEAFRHLIAGAFDEAIGAILRGQLEGEKRFIDESIDAGFLNHFHIAGVPLYHGCRENIGLRLGSYAPTRDEIERSARDYRRRRRARAYGVGARRTKSVPRSTRRSKHIAVARWRRRRYPISIYIGRALYGE